jgi:hypothetical protein
MILELAILNVRPGRAAEFEQAFHQAQRLSRPWSATSLMSFSAASRSRTSTCCSFGGSGSRIIPKDFASTLSPWMAHD